MLEPARLTTPDGVHHFINIIDIPHKKVNVERMGMFLVPGRIEYTRFKFSAIIEDLTTNWILEWIDSINHDLQGYVTPVKRDFVIDYEIGGLEMQMQFEGAMPLSWTAGGHAPMATMVTLEIIFDSFKYNEEPSNLYKRRVLLESMDFSRKGFWE